MQSGIHKKDQKKTSQHFVLPYELETAHYDGFSTGVGAIRRFLGSLTSSFSFSLASRLVPAALTIMVRGVSGGVATGIPVTFVELEAVKAGTLPAMSVGLLTTPVGTDDGCVAIDDVEFDLVGDGGRWEAGSNEAGGDGAANELAELRCWGCEPLGNGDGGAKLVVGVGVGVFCVELTLFMLAPPAMVLGGPISPLYMSPNSPAAKERLEQKPSDDEIINVRPSLDQARSVNVAQCKLLTTQMGVFCCVSYSRTES